MGETIRVLIVEDHAVLRHSLHVFLATEPGLEVVEEAINGVEAVAKTRALQPHVVLIDLLLPGEDSSAVIATLKAENPDVHILVLTGLVDEKQIWPALLAGAAGCVPMSAPPQALLHAIRHRQRGETALAATLVREALFELDPPALVGDLVPA